jgi:FkbM family methyltransferase
MNWIANANYGDEEFQQWLDEFLRYIRQTEKTAHTWIDVGAHRGEVTNLMLKHSTVQDQIHSFEPNQYRYKKLRKKFRNHSNVLLWPIAVSNTMTMSDFFVPWLRILDGGSFLKFSPAGFQKRFCTNNPVLTIPLNQINWNTCPPITFVKIDAEGNDFLIIQQAQDIIERHRPIILFEFSGMLSGNHHGYTTETWFDFFKSNNYHLRAPYGGRNTEYILDRYETYAPELYNLLAVPNEKPLPF